MANQFKAIEITPKEEQRWNNLIYKAINGSYRNSIAFEYAQELNGREIHTFIFQQEGIDIAGAHYSLKGQFKNFFTIADILSGFVFLNEPDQDLIKFLINHFIGWAKKSKASYIRINTYLPSTISGVETQYNKIITKELEGFGFNKIQPGLHTYWIDLTLTEDQMLAKMKKQTRHDIRKCMKSSVKVIRHDAPTNQLLEKFWNLYSNISDHKGFSSLPKERFIKEVFGLMEAKQASLFEYIYNDEVINMTFASTFGIVAPLYGGTNYHYNNIIDCPSVGHLAQWTIILYLKSIGSKKYDMGFCPGSVPVENHPRYSIWRFKFGYQGDHVEFLPTFGKALNPIRGRIFQYWRYKK